MSSACEATIRSLVALATVLAVACGSEPAAGPTPPTPPPTPPSQSYAVASITDGDTLRFSPAVSGTTALRMLNIDAPEAAQAPWGSASRAELQRLAPVGSEITIETDQTRIDAFDRLLGHAIRRDGVNLNIEQVRQGHAVVYVIWPNMNRFSEYRSAQIEAQSAGRGVWDPASPLRELPYGTGSVSTATRRSVPSATFSHARMWRLLTTRGCTSTIACSSTTAPTRPRPGISRARAMGRAPTRRAASRQGNEVTPEPVAHAD